MAFQRSIHRRDWRRFKPASYRQSPGEEPVDLWTTAPCEEARVAYAETLAIFEAGDFDKAAEMMDAYLTKYPEDKVAPHLGEHIKYFQELRPAQWEGIIRFMEK